MPTYTGKYSDKSVKLNRQGSERADEAGNASRKPVGRELDEGMISDHGSGPGGGSSKLPRRA